MSDTIQVYAQDGNRRGINKEFLGDVMMVRLAFVGCGSIQQVHYRNLTTLDEIEFVGHCDTERDRAQEAAAQYGGEAYTDYRVMFEEVKPHAVYVAVPPYAHGDIEIEAARKGIHLFIEKPIALDCATAKAVSEAVRKSGVLCSVGYCFRYSDTTVRARKMLRGKTPSLIMGLWSSGLPEIWWWRQMDKSGGQIMVQTTHLIDMIRYLCGDVAEVYAAGASGCMNQIKDYDIHDSSVITMCMKTGATASIASSCVAGYNGHKFLDIVTPESSFHLSDNRLTVREDGKLSQYHPKKDMYFEESRSFIEAVRTGKRNRLRCTYSDALKTFKVTAAANESIQSGLPVKV